LAVSDLAFDRGPASDPGLANSSAKAADVVKGASAFDGKVASIKMETTKLGWGVRIRTWEWRNQNPLIWFLKSMHVLKNCQIRPIIDQ
jgi:hypothetical protein